MKHQKITPIALTVGLLFGSAAYAAADTPAQGTELQQVKVKGRRNAPAAVERVNAEVIQDQMIRDNRDLVRYSPDVGVADQGRHQKGFAIRGVEDNRVGISIDGVSLPDSEENSLYKRYGNLNTSRQSIDPELARSVEVVKGADSFNQGSGSLGGGVNYRTLGAADIVQPGNKLGFLLRSGYASKNREWVNTAGTGYQGEKAEAVLLYSHRHGHEMKSRGGYTIPEDSLKTRDYGSSRQIPDAAKHKSHSFLAKWAWQFNDNHRAGLSLSGQQGNNYIIEDSGVWSSSKYRESDDRAKRRTWNAFYEFTPNSDWLSLVKADLDYQKAVSSAYNYEGTREGYDWAGRYKEREPSDDNIRIFTTRLKRLSLRADTQPLSLGSTRHTLSFKAAAARREFDILHRDRYFLSGAYLPYKEETMMYPVKTTQYNFSLHDRIVFNNTFSGYAGIRYDYSKVQPQDLNGLSCRNCLVPKPADSTFKGFSWVLGADAKLNNSWKLGYSIGTGFRVPNASEMYFDYRGNAAGEWLSNPNLKAERSLTQNLSLNGNGKAGNLAVNLHHTRYKDFLYEQEVLEREDNPFYPWYSNNPYRYKPMQQMQNSDKAKIYGIELTGRLNLNSITPLPEGWKLFGTLGYSRGNLAGDADLLSIQPFKTVIGLDYEQPEGKWGVLSRLTYTGAKHAGDAKYKNCNDPDNRDEGKCIYSVWPHLNKSAWVFDLFGYYKPSEKLTVRAGVYNLFNRKYHTWDSLRGLNITGGLVNSVGARPNRTYGGYPGLERFYAPGRNYSFSVELKF
ncbi:TonB-dependent hemoglobin/transferrin/lactoferrin family receptor [Kingella pumchi]|uniref:TonB-dependent hemoglobin/transferrin/lactoferrin family receptor n=1 Tax=Kingella pumchi TaxID=2779506 RepID=A0ABS9NKC1_9NEIS|nr:TonB-dependent hemoglobin/transferrin/lactoferrin family receptor [Kingella pumchi]MCG6503234.1 TonB-dependent hemoglobin/transferrin/lactoferrin family receptor [Kingella pumchi]